MTDDERHLIAGETYRYPRAEHVDRPMVDGLPNFYWHTSTPGVPKAKLERGISRIPPVTGDAGSERVPAVLVRSTPWKAGTPQTPWHDSFDRASGTLQYFGDNKVDEVTGQVKEDDPADVLGNKALLAAHWAHASDSADERADSAPVLVFTGVPVAGRQKGNVRFEGLGVVTSARFVRQVDVLTDVAYPNILFDIRFLDLSEDRDRADWAWISARRMAGSRTVADAHAPTVWKNWVRGGLDALDGLTARRWRVEPLSST